MRNIKITADATNPNNRRIHVDGSQWCKVYGWDTADVEFKAKTIAEALAAPQVIANMGQSHQLEYKVK